VYGQLANVDFNTGVFPVTQLFGRDRFAVADKLVDSDSRKTVKKSGGAQSKEARI